MNLAIPKLQQRLARRIRIARRRLRWVIRIGAPKGEAGDMWGDVAFAEDLSFALNRLGQCVRVERLDPNPNSSKGYWDDVVLNLRGLTNPVLEPNRVNMLWVISHPDLVEDVELKLGWHKIYAASHAWATTRAAEAGVAVQPLLQSVSKDRFSPDGLKTKHEVLFVGTTRGVGRPVVKDVAEICDNLEIYGHGWEGIVKPTQIVSDRLNFSDVPAAYRGAHRVLNDHWADMKREGFISNRLFDAVASGALVISDEINGMSEIFGASVRSYKSQTELKKLISSESGWPGSAERRDQALRVLQHESFDARADVLLKDALSSFGSSQQS